MLRFTGAYKVALDTEPSTGALHHRITVHFIVCPANVHTAGEVKTTRQSRREKAARAEREMANLRRRWSNALAADPAYNPNLSLDVASDPYTSLALPPRPCHSRANALPH